MIFPAILVSTALVAQAAAACTRASLQEVVTAYFHAQAAGKPSLLSFSKNATYQENDVTTDIAKGVLSQAVTIDLSRSIFDTTECSTFTEISSATDKHPYVIDTRMAVSDNTATSIQSVVADSGDWVFNATGQLYWAKKETWEPLPEAKRDTRAVIRAAGDAYLDSWADGKVKVPYGTPIMNNVRHEQVHTSRICDNHLSSERN